MARWVHSSTMATFPAPATSNGAGGLFRYIGEIMQHVPLFRLWHIQDYVTLDVIGAS